MMLSFYAVKVILRAAEVELKNSVTFILTKFVLCAIFVRNESKIVLYIKVKITIIDLFISNPLRILSNELQPLCIID